MDRPVVKHTVQQVFNIVTQLLFGLHASDTFSS
jgi:hypothetical protein